MNYIEFDEVVAESMLIIGGGDDEVAQNFAKTFIWRGLQKLGSTDDTIEVCKVTAKNFLLIKPKNMKRLDEMALFDSNDCFIPHVFHAGVSRIYPNTESYRYSYTNDDGTTTTELCVPVDLSENKTAYVLGSNGNRVAYAYLRYYPYPMDTSGNPLIREDEVEALTAYVRYKWSQRKNENQSEIAQNLSEWLRLADYCRAEKKASDFTNEVKKSIASQWQRMIPNFNRSRF
jgi:hypothetical protein